MVVGEKTNNIQKENLSGRSTLAGLNSVTRRNHGPLLPPCKHITLGPITANDNDILRNTVVSKRRIRVDII